MTKSVQALNDKGLLAIVAALCLVACLCVCSPGQAYADASEGVDEAVATEDANVSDDVDDDGKSTVDVADEDPAKDTGVDDDVVESGENASLNDEEGSGFVEGAGSEDSAVDNGSADASNVEFKDEESASGLEEDDSANVAPTQAEPTVGNEAEIIPTGDAEPVEDAADAVAQEAPAAQTDAEATPANESSAGPSESGENADLSATKTAAVVPAQTALVKSAKPQKAAATKSAKKASALPKSGWYSLRAAENTKLYLQVKGSNSKKGTAIVLSKGNTATGQAFKLVKTKGSYRILTGAGFNSRLFMNPSGKVYVTRSGGKGTLFMLEYAGKSTYRLVNVATGYALGIRGSVSSGRSLVGMKVNAANDKQSFKLTARAGLLKEGIYAARAKKNTKRVLASKSNSTDVGAKAAISTYKRLLPQKWEVKQVDGRSNVYTLESIATGYRLTAAQDKPATLRKASTTKRQWWTPVGANGSVVFKNVLTGQAIELTKGKTGAGTLVKCAKRTMKTQQRWSLKRVVPISSGYYEFDNGANGALSLQITGGSKADNAAAVVDATVEGSTASCWYYDAKAKTLKSNDSGKLLTAKAGRVATGSALVQSASGARGQKWNFEYVGGGMFKLVPAENASLAVGAVVANAKAATKLGASGSSTLYKWHAVSSKPYGESYINLPFSIATMAKWQKAGNPYISGYTLKTLRSLLNPKNGQKLKFMDLRRSTGISGSALNKFINTYGSDGKLKGLGKAFVDAADAYDINEVYLLSHAILESGWGKSELASGYYYGGGYVDGKYRKKGTYYNFFGIGAYDSSPLSGGRKMAIINGWNTPAKAVKGAAKWISGNYIYGKNIDGGKYSQPTLYMMKWDIKRTKEVRQYGWHQYATDPNWADSIARLMGEAYSLVNKTVSKSYIMPRYK